MATTRKPAPTPFSAAIRLLARRPHAVAEIRRALAKKFTGEAEIDSAIARLREIGYLDDRKFARQYASFLAAHRGFGRERVRLELKSRLVDYRAIDEALDQAFEEIPERSLLERALDKKLRTLRLPLTQRKFYSLAQSMMRLGFRSDDIMRVMHERPELKPVAEKIDPLSD
ncbi:MAG: regulatory protein RecX [Terriglobia bacterium]